jgi:hypothetical protein
MLVDGGHGDIKQLSYQVLRELDSFVLVTDFQSIPARLGRENKELGGRVADLLFLLC